MKRRASLAGTRRNQSDGLAGGGEAPDFAAATRDELWVGGVLAERRLSHGVAFDEGARTFARDEADEELLALSAAAIARLREAVDDDARVRLVASARRVRGIVMTEAAMTITIGGVSIVGSDASMLRATLRKAAVRVSPATLPIVWRNGSGAVLLHEAVGHAAEHAAPAIAWPSWLEVRDLPPFPIDDRGVTARAADLLREPPACFRRASFRDVPLRRMTRLVASQKGAPFELPAEFIDVELIAGGSYDPLTDMVTLEVAVSSVGPFTFRRSRAAIAASLIGATGEPVEYPGVICSREGQELPIASSAPLMVTR